VVKKSHVFEALNLGMDKYAALRISIDKRTTEDELRGFVLELKNCVETLAKLGI
jgi:cysteine sulfinate desulfinase/cysteine desulfurase-like protein